MDRDLTEELERKRALVDDALQAFLSDAAVGEPVANLHEGLAYALGLDLEPAARRGKRIRPVLCLLTAEALGADAAQALPFAMAVEIMHNFFLVHDDIEDGDRFRHGRDSVWVRYGQAHGINIGDLLAIRIFAAALSATPTPTPAKTRIDLLELLIETLERTHAGQALDLNALGQDTIAMDHYLEIATNKTGYYLAAPMIGAAIVADAEASTIDALRRLAPCLGPLYQIVDDTIDLTSGKGRDAAGSDLREGKRTFLVAHTAAEADADEHAELFAILNQARDETTDAHIQRAIDLFTRYDAVAAGRARCDALMGQVRAILADAPEALRQAPLRVLEAMAGRNS